MSEKNLQECNCICHDKLLLSNPPKPASDYCKECACNLPKQDNKSEKKSLCQHGSLIKDMNCALCELENRMERVERNNATNTEIIMRKFNVINERLSTIESVLRPYLKPNTKKDIDLLEQRLVIIELNIHNLKMKRIGFKEKCTNCDGKGKVYLTSSIDNCIATCDMCKGEEYGTGIIAIK